MWVEMTLILLLRSNEGDRVLSPPLLPTFSEPFIFANVVLISSPSLLYLRRSESEQVPVTN